MVTWPESGAVEERVNVDLGCIELRCEPWQECASGECVGDAPDPDLTSPFAPSLRDPSGESCEG
jgi:hypothetical protein